MAEDLKVMLVGDADTRAALRKTLLAAGISPTTEAGHGTEAFTAAHQTPIDVALVLLDEPIARPLRTIEALSAGEQASPTIVVSPTSDREHIRKAMLAGARDFLVKPKASELFQAITAVREAEQRRRVLVTETAEHPRTGEVLVVFGAKGGVGKTTLAVNLAVSLAQQSKQRVALVDLDTQLGDVGVMLDAVPEHTIVDAAKMVDRLEPHLIQTLMREDPNGIDVLAGPLRPQEGEFISAHHVSKIVEVMASTYDYVVVDTAPQFTDTLLPALEAATMLLLVTTPDVAALKNTKLALNVLKSWNYTTDKVKMVVTNAYSDDGASQKDIEEALEYPVYWVLPHDAAVAAAGRLGKPVVVFKPNSKMPQKVTELARSIAGATKPKGRLAGMFRR